MNSGAGDMERRLSEEAAEWFIEFRTGALDERARRRFDSWIRTSPEHVRAYLECAAIWEEADGLDALGRLDAGTLMARVREEANVVPLGVRTPLPVAAPVEGVRRPATWRAGVTAGIAATVLAVVAWMVLEARSGYATGVGEQRSLTLQDGSIVELNARSRIKVRLSHAERRVELLAGQALFRVAKDPSRPFVVHSGATSVRAVGTQFDVYRKPQGTVVTVLEGSVLVSRPRPAIEQRLPQVSIPEAPGSSPPAAGRVASRPVRQPPRVLLGAGEQVVDAGGALARQPVVNLRAVTAWTQRQLVFESTTLQEIADELNRYSTRRFIVDPSAPGELRLSGIFSAADVDFLVRFLRERPEIRVESSADRVVIHGAPSRK